MEINSLVRFQQQYGWTVAGIFLSGMTPGYILFAIFFFHIFSATVGALTLRSTVDDNRNVAKKISIVQSGRSLVAKKVHRVLEYWILLFALILNCAIVVLVNVGFIVATLQFNKVEVFFAEIALAAFETVLEQFCCVEIYFVS